MKFSKIIGKIDPKLVEQAEIKLSKMFLELALRYEANEHGTKLGGDPLVFTLMYPTEHVCTLNMPTAATDGKRFYWNPKFVLKKSQIGLRVLANHEAWHSLYMHPQRRGSRLPKLWNIAVDYIVNFNCFEDLQARIQRTREYKSPEDLFLNHLGKFKTLNEYAELLKDPFKQYAAEDLRDLAAGIKSSVKLPHPNDERELTEEQKQELEKLEKLEKFMFADPKLDEGMRSPEKIYDFLYKLLPKCPKCGSIGMYKFPKKSKQQKKDKDSEEKSDEKSDKKSDKKESCCGDKHEHGEGCNGNEPGDSCCGDNSEEGEGGCCSDGFDIFDLGGTVDEHMDSEETPEKTARRISDAMATAKQMAGVIPAALEDELGKLTAPKISWQDIVRIRLLKARSGKGRNDWSRFKTKPMFSGLLTPKKKTYSAKFGCLLDTSGSMSPDDMALGISQLASLDERSEGIIVPADAEIMWDKATVIAKCSAEELSKVKVFGRGGTMFGGFFSDYEKKIGKCDFLILITDGYLGDQDVASMVNPGVDVLWLITSNLDFKPPFGRAFNLR